MSIKINAIYANNMILCMYSAIKNNLYKTRYFRNLKIATTILTNLVS